MNEQEFKEKYLSEIPIYAAWGDYVNRTILSSLPALLGPGQDPELFLKIPPKPRVKTVDSIISKAFFRGKNYENPYAEIEDKAGVRYVVLLRSHITVISSIIEATSIWTRSKDRDFEREIIENPWVFGYQSVHYVVKNTNLINHNGVEIPSRTPCEIQIRTLSQHAYCELTHDTVYQPKLRATPTVLRSVAKSMALIEATDDIFENVNQAISGASAKMSALIENLLRLYQRITKPEYEEKANVFILDAFNELLDRVSLGDVEKFVFENPSIPEIITRRSKTLFLYRQPIVLLLLYLVSRYRNQFKTLWPLTEEEMRPLYSDLGISLDGSV